ncbi:MAG: hypothetical protein K9I47_12310 [Bacteroidales bacterium]|nr:hypothetical protein [Bacteroidales bacterium]
MDDDIKTYDDNIFSEQETAALQSRSIYGHANVKIINQKREEEKDEFVFTFETPRKKIVSFSESLKKYDTYYKIKEKYYLRVIDSLFKKNNFLALSLQLSDGVISEEEYEKELENNQEKYIIETQKLENPNHLHIINDIGAVYK